MNTCVIFTKRAKAFVRIFRIKKEILQFEKGLKEIE